MTWYGPSRIALTRARRWTVVAAVLLSTVMYSHVRPTFADTLIGGSSADFLQFEVGGRSAGMGGAHTAVPTGVTSQFWNPALLTSLQNPEVGALHANWLDDLSYEWVGYARPINPRVGVGSASVAYFHMPSIQGVDEFNNPTEPFRVYDLAVTLGLARPMARGVSAGVNVKMIRQTLATVSATGAAADIGLAATVHGATVGLAIQNLGPSIAYSDAGSYPLPRQLRFGVSRAFMQNKLLVAADYNSPNDYYDDVRIGTEFKAHRNVSVRLGYRYEMGSSGDPVTGLSYGLGLHFGQVSMDYAMTPSSDFDNVQRFALGYSFGGGAEERPEKPASPKKDKPLPPRPPKQPTTTASAPKAKAKEKAAEPVKVLVDTKALAAAPAPATSATSTKTDAASTPAVTDAPKTETVAANNVAPVVSAPSEKTTPVEKPAPAPSAPSKDEKPAADASSDKSSEKATDKREVEETREAKAPKPAKVSLEHDVVLLGYSSQSSAQAEMKALQLLGFRTKDAAIVPDPKGGYAIRLAQMKSKDSADDMVANLARMSFRAVVQTVQR